MTATQYSPEHADVYEAVSSARGRNWTGEADELTALILERFPQARSLLDVACGTGVHLERFAERFAEVAGVEISPAMRDRARRRLGGTPVHDGDMRDFDLGRTFDAVTCLCYSIGYMASVAELDAAAARMAHHLNPGGVAVVEPWWFADRFLDGYVAGSVAHQDGRVISRVSHSVRKGRACHMTVRFTVADADGIRDFTEHEICSLFTEEEYLGAFTRAGLRTEFIEGGPNGHGLLVGVRD
ncbi:trans-aconitate 2-methyltransferase [Actinomadura sp. WMMB 499]|uniref:class I SAM-dependent methyltransferase n=1 Tax=Actinomadura sp. WMMB 499 TaxID=1219491 RepID=UPI0012442D91|nr:class I SAM-dependent methyltransferase [Actinomadura sp. WMMB 499]QFG24801.1 class I SAM-dependent methyltransferase [Actinomadura sp. WMMB 499]